jgi:hypothetical protein
MICSDDDVENFCWYCHICCAHMNLKYAICVEHNCSIGDRSVIMPAKEERWCNSGSKSLDKHEPRDILHYHVERHYQSFAVAVRQNDMIKNIVSVFYRIQCPETLPELRDALVHEWDNIPQAFMHRLVICIGEAVVAARGGYACYWNQQTSILHDNLCLSHSTKSL